MNSEMERKIKEMYLELKEEQKAQKEAKVLLQDLKEKRKEQEQKPEVQEYLQLRKQIKEVTEKANAGVETDQTFFDTLTQYYFYGEEETNGIYVYMGTFCNKNESDIVHGSHVMQIPRNSYKNFGWNEYKDIEKHYAEASIEIPRRETEKFEEENIVLFPEMQSDAQELYGLVQRMFFQYVIELGQEEAVTRIIEEFGTPELVAKRKRSIELK